MDKQILDKLHIATFEDDTQVIEDISNKHDIVSYFKNVADNDLKIIGFRYAAAVGDIDLLEFIVNNFECKTEYDECILNFNSGILHASTEKKNYEESGNYLLKALEYVETHNQKIKIGDKNYSRDFKAIVIFYVGYYYFRINKSYKAKEYITRAKEIFTYKTKNFKKAVSCNALLSSICLMRGNTFEARKYFRQIERYDIELGSMSYDLSNNLLYLYYIEENYEECNRRIDLALKDIDNYSNVNRYFFYMMAALVCFATTKYEKAKDYIDVSLSLIDDLKKFTDEEVVIYKKALTIITSTNPSSDDITFLKRVFIAHLVDTGEYATIIMITRYIDEYGHSKLKESVKGSVI